MHDSFLAFRNRPFKWLFAITFMTTFAIFIHDTLVGYALYKMTKDPMTLGLMGLSEALPYIFISVFGGHIADKYNKKVVVGLAFLAILSSVGFVAYILSSTHLALAGKLTLIYLALIVGGFARGIFSPAKFALQTALTPRAQYTSAATWTSIAWQIGMVAGPAAFGFLHGKLQFTYLQTLYMVILLLLMSIFCLIFVPHVENVAHKVPEKIWHSIKEGFKFVKETKILLYAISLDLFSVLFGGIVALLPVFAIDILKVGAEGLGILASSSSAGAVLVMLILTKFPPLKHAWRNLLWAITGFALATIVFAISTQFWLSVAMLFLIGAFDSISVVIRQAILQHFPPEHLRGRVSAVNGMFISASNEIGRFESGMAAKLMGTVPSVLFGAGVTLAIVALVAAKSKSIFKIQIK